jgi:O-antigen ligase
MKPLPITLYILSTIIICFTIIYLPFYDTRNLFKSYVTEKVFLFAAVTGVLLLIQALTVIFSPNYSNNFRLTWLDLALVALVAYLSLNRLLISEMGGITLKYLQLLILCIFYLIIRRIPSKYYQYFIYSLLISGIIQAVYGNLQLYDVYPSRHHIFNITGSFFNPGPYSGYLAIIFSIALAFYLKNKLQQPETILQQPETTLNRGGNDELSEAKQPETIPNRGGNDELSEAKPPETIKEIKAYFEKYLSLFAIITILLVIPATRSRASWLAIIVSTIYIAFCLLPVKPLLNKYLTTKLRKLLFGSGIILVGIAFLFGIYYFKKDSADGRLLIWKVSSEMIKDKPVLGHGYEKFQADYMDYQASYFEKDPESEESYVADDIIYPFNEYVKLAVESGIMGIGLLMAALLFVFQTGKNGKKGINSLALKAGIIALMVFAFFSYPSEILPVLLTLTILLALLAREKEFLFHKKVFPESAGTNRHKILSWPYPIALIILVIGMYFPSRRLYQAYFFWDEGYKIYQMNAFNECLESYEESYDVLKNNGEYLIMYGKALSMADKHEDAVEVLCRAEKFQKNTILYTAIGDSYKELGKPEDAEKAYIKAASMIPGRFYAKYLLAKLYEETEQYEKAKIMANEILSKEEKILSKAIEEMKDEMEEILEK